MNARIVTLIIFLQLQVDLKELLFLEPLLFEVHSVIHTQDCDNIVLSKRKGSAF